MIIEKTDSSQLTIHQVTQSLWAKSHPYKQLLAHLIDTGCCAKAFLSAVSSRAYLSFLAKQWHCSLDETLSIAAYLAALHDIGKATPQFQSQDEQLYVRLTASGTDSLFPRKHYSQARHEYHSARIALRIWKGRKMPSQLCGPYARILSLHHQRIEESDRVQSPPDIWTELQNAREKTVRETFLAPNQLPCPDNMDAVCILLTGLIILCDWVASSGPFDIVPEVDENYTAHSMEIAEQTMRRYGLIGDRASLEIGAFHTVWPSIQQPRDIQNKCEQADPEAPLTIIEAPMGEGKTEASLYLAERMCSKWEKRGIYVALPTQATSNQMHARATAMLEAIHGGHARLLHGTAFLQTEEPCIQSDDAQEAERWLGSLRMGLLDENGVGTVDQAMAGVLKARFSVLRLLGLTGKVLVIDELHAYDAYMSEIIRSLLHWCGVLCIPVILLSATLQDNQREIYISCFTKKDSVPALSASYPLITQVDRKGQVTQIEATAVLNTQYDFVPVPYGRDAEKIAWHAVDQIKEGGCYCVLLNTVRKSQEVYRALREIKDNNTTLYLFHARFPVGRREEIEKECLRSFGKGRGTERPTKAILVATQVVEQSLDLDFDGMLTELAPIDLLLQRAGRVHRHRDRIRPKGMEKPVIFVSLPDDNAKPNPDKRYEENGYVYAPFLLNNTEHLVDQSLCVQVPDDMRSVIAKVYGQITQENMAVWQERAFNQQLMQANARGVSFPEPQEDVFFAAESHPEFINMEVDDGFEPTARASTRLGEPTIRIAFVTPELFDALKAEHLTREQQLEIYRGSVALPRKQFFGADLKSDTLYEIENGLLRGCFIANNRERFQVGNRTLINDPDLGVMWEE